jgi:16S rRNA (guanine966-N2)-methyltransferase
MRIIAGEARGRRLAPVRGQQVRPTGDKVREALFSILLARFQRPGPDTSVVLDLYAGSGALGLEALSRGADEAHFVEMDPAAAATVQANLDLCGFTARGRVHRSSANSFLATPRQRVSGCDLVFLDPPYADLEALPACLAALSPPLLAADAVVVAEHDARHEPPQEIGCLHRVHGRIWGPTAMSFYRPAAASNA